MKVARTVRFSDGSSQIGPTDDGTQHTGAECTVSCPPSIEVDRSSLHCYRTLAGVDCHNQADPYRNGATALASPAPVRVEH